jgi:hypothetical protein
MHNRLLFVRFVFVFVLNTVLFGLIFWSCLGLGFSSCLGVLSWCSLAFTPCRLLYSKSWAWSSLTIYFWAYRVLPFGIFLDFSYAIIFAPALLYIV